MKLVKSLTFREKQWASGVSAFSMNEKRGLWTDNEQVDHLFFPPEERAQIKALACQLPTERGIPLSRFSITEIVREVISAAIEPSTPKVFVTRKHYFQEQNQESLYAGVNT